jgi:uncharacterized alkaline shock family protein YloU
MKDIKSKKECDKTGPASTIINNGKDGELGVIKIHENVISSLVRKAALSVDGVSRLAGSTFVDNLAEIVGSRKISDRAISIRMDEDKIEIELKINMKFGFKVPEVASNVQSTIIEDVEAVTGMNVVCVNVIVQEIEDVAENNDEDAEEDSK